MRVLIAGAGRAALAVAIHLRASAHHVTLIDRDEAAAKRAFERYGLVSLVGDATDALLLKDADLHRTDVVLAMLRRDSDNLAVALLARSAGVGRVLVRMRDTEYRSVYETAGVNGILSETDVFVGALAIAVEYDSISHVMTLGSGDSVAFELVLPEDAAAAMKSVSSLAAEPGFPKSCVFGGMTDIHGAFEPPRGASIIVPGMRLLLVARRSELPEVVGFFLRRAEGPMAS